MTTNVSASGKSPIQFAVLFEDVSGGLVEIVRRARKKVIDRRDRQFLRRNIQATRQIFKLSRLFVVQSDRNRHERTPGSRRTDQVDEGLSDIESATIPTPSDSNRDGIRDKFEAAI